MMNALEHLPERLGITALGIKTRFVFAIGIELFCMALSRALYHSGRSFASIELARTLPRLITALVLWLLMSDVIFNRRPDLQPLQRSLFIGSVWLAICTAVLFCGYNDTSIHDVPILVITALPVGVHEESFFRGSLQNAIEKRIGVVGGLIVTIISFMLFHVGI